LKNGKTDIPMCMGVIVDGNRRWAKENGSSSFEGHRAGYAKLKEFAVWTRDSGIKYLIAYVFSTENWSRGEGEVSYLMDLLRLMLGKERAWANKEGIKIKVAGSRDRLDQDIVRLVEETERETAKNDSLTFVLALNYGGRSEIIEAARKAALEGEITEESINKHLFTADIPDPDLIVRTGGNYRLSNFLPWQSIYSELIFVGKYFPALCKADFGDIMIEYASRERRFGK